MYSRVGRHERIPAIKPGDCECILYVLHKLYGNILSMCRVPMNRETLNSFGEFKSKRSGDSYTVYTVCTY